MEPLGQGLDGQVMTVLRHARLYPKRSEDSPIVKALAHKRGDTDASVMAASAAMVMGWGWWGGGL